LLCGFALQAAEPEDSTLFVLSHVIAQPGETISMPYSINTIHDIGGFNFLFSHESNALEAIEMLSDGTRSEGLTTFTWALVNSSPDVIAGVAVFFQDYIPAGDGPISNLVMTVDQSLPSGCLLPLTFFSEAGGGGRRNAITDPEGINDYFPDFNNGSILIPLDTAVGEWFLPGDVNVNAVGYEIADLMLMIDQLSEGIDSYWHEAAQARNSDVNVDLLPWTIADLLLMMDVVNSTLPPPTEGPVTEVIHLPGDSIWFDAYEGTPVDTLEIPIYVVNSIPAGGLSFKLSYSLYELEFVSYSLDGTRMPPEWSTVSAVERSDGLMFFATPGLGSSPQYHMMPAGDGLIVTLKFAVLAPATNYFDVHFERLQHHGQVNGYGTFAWEWPYWHLASFQNVDKAMYFSFLYGDADGSGFIDIDDVVYLINYIFNSGPPPPVYDAGDFNRDFFVDIDDVTALLGFIFG
jgi:hypothetical protein